MEVFAHRPFSAVSLFWQPRKGAFSLTVICKASFLLRAVESPIADDTDCPNEEDNHWNDDPSRSVYSPSDLIPFKRKADVLLVGNAFSPRKEPVRSLMVRLVVGEVDKSIEVFADRFFAQDGTLHEGARFVKMPLRYERAAGGPDTVNPVGIAMTGPPDTYGRRPVPNLQPPGLFITRWTDVIPPIGFGPIAASWPDRRGKLGRHAPTWPPAGWHWAGQPLPEDVDIGYFNAAPPDQQVDELRENERIVLEHLHPDQPRLVTSLPGVRPAAVVERRGVAEPVVMRADTLWIDTDRSMCTVTWRGQVPVHDPAEAGRVLITAENIRDRMADASADMQQGDEIGRTQVAMPQHEPIMPFISPRLGEKSIADTGRSLGGQRNVPDLAHATGGIEEISPEDLNEADDSSASPLGRSPLPQQPQQAASERAYEHPGEEAAQTAVIGHRGASELKPALPFAPPYAGPALPIAKHAAVPSPAPAMPSATPASPQPVVPPALVRPAVTRDPIAPPVKTSVWAGGDAGGSGPAAAGYATEPSVPPQPISAAVHMPNAAAAGVLAASNAAAAAISKTHESEAEKRAPGGNVPQPSEKPREIVKLLWFDPQSIARIRRHEQWRIVLAELELRLLDEGKDEDDASQEQNNPKDRRDVFEVLARAEPVGPEGIKQAFARALREDGKFEPPLVLVASELEFPFDEIATLKATVTAVTPLAAGDKKLKEVLETVEELLKTPWLQGSGGIAEGLTEKVKETFAHAKRMLPPDYLDSHTERMLLQERCYQRRTVYGKRWIRCVLREAGGNLPVYIPEALKDELPMFRRVRVRMLAEIDVREDQYEASACALKVVGLGRVVAPMA